MKVKKTAKNIQYVIPVGNAWMVKSAKSAKFTLITDNKRDALLLQKKLQKTLILTSLYMGKTAKS